MEYVLLDNNCNESVIYNDKENDDELYIIGDEDDYVKNLTNTIFIKKDEFLNEIKESYKDNKRLLQTAKFDAIRSNLFIDNNVVSSNDFLNFTEKIDMLPFFTQATLGKPYYLILNKIGQNIHLGEDPRGSHLGDPNRLKFAYNKKNKEAIISKILTSFKINDSLIPEVLDQYEIIININDNTVLLDIVKLEK